MEIIECKPTFKIEVKADNSDIERVDEEKLPTWKTFISAFFTLLLIIVIFTYPIWMTHIILEGIKYSRKIVETENLINVNSSII
jgi:hypothetical protein